jgi:hypothetical protein
MKEDNSFEALMNPGEAENFFDVANLSAFEPDATTEYNRTNALWLAEFCRLIYRRGEDEIPRPTGFRARDIFLTPHNWREENFFNIDDTQVALFISTTLKCGALVFRGTLGPKDLLTDAEFVLVDWLPGGGRVHVGFWEALQKVWERIEERLTGFPHPVFYTGHSLGAALATLAAARALLEKRLPKPGAIYTFGSPRVGDATFTALLQDVYHCRVVNDNDIVATVPPPLPLLFQHDGELHHIRHDGRIEVRPRGENLLRTIRPSFLLERTAGALNGLFAGFKAPSFRAFGLGLPEQLTDHTPVNYTAHLEDAG